MKKNIKYSTFITILFLMIPVLLYSQKPEDNCNKLNKNENRSLSAEINKDCTWTINYDNFEVEYDAIKAKSDLEKENIPNVNIKKNVIFGVATYKLVIGCYISKEKAVQDFVNFKKTFDKLGGKNSKIIKESR